MISTINLLTIHTKSFIKICSSSICERTKSTYSTNPVLFEYNNCIQTRYQYRAASQFSHNTSVPDPHVFGPPGSGSFYHNAKLVRKTLIPTILWLFLTFLSLENYVNVPSKSNKQKKIVLKMIFLLAS